MPNIISLSSDDAGVTIAYNGGVYTVTAAQIKAAYAADGSAIGTRKTKVQAALATEASKQVQGHLDAAGIVIDFDPATGKPLSVEVN